jgi:hypothetical protein
MAENDWVALAHKPAVADGAALSNSTAPTAIEPQPGQVTMGGWRAEQIFDVFAFGKLTTPAASVATLKIGLYIGGAGGTKIAESAAVAPVVSATNWQWQLKGKLFVRATGIGATSSMIGCGSLWLPATVSTLSGTIQTLDAAAPAPVTTVDLTTAKAISLVATYGTAQSTSSITCMGFYVLALN